MGEDGISTFVHPRGRVGRVDLVTARGHTLLDVVIADS